MTSTAFPYEVIEEYVRGGCSIIYKIRSAGGGVDDAREFVLKTMSMGDEDPQNVKRFYMEYEFLRAFPHPNLIIVKDYFEDWHGRPAYVMEWVEGNTWQQYWKEKPALENSRDFLAKFRQLANVLDFIHKHNIIHRDLKPQNILISQEGELKLIDFGIMKVADMTLYTHRNTFMGSAYYVAPECLSGEKVTKTADIFSLGVMLYDLFTGMKPFQGHTLGETIYQRLVKKPQPPSSVADTPEALDTIILKMLDRDPYARHQSCDEVFQALEGIFGKFSHDPGLSDQPEIDILTKGPFLHAGFQTSFTLDMDGNNMLYLLGEEGSGKTTLLENFCSRQFGESVIRLDCRPNSNEMEFMEFILRNVVIPHAMHRELTQWREILGAALPGLKWDSPHANQPLTNATILSAFQQMMLAVRENVVIVIEDLQEASPSLLNFVLQIAALVTSKVNPHHHLILTTQRLIPFLSSLGEPKHVPFPDIITLSDYLTHRIGGCQIPLELTESLVKISGENTGRFLQIVNQFMDNGRLAVHNGVLVLEEDQFDLETLPAHYATAPSEAADLTTEQLQVLEWIALSPDAIDMNILQAVTRLNMADLGAVISVASEKNLIEFKAGNTDGFRWKNQTVRDFLVSSLSQDEKNRRFLFLAQVIESASEQFLAYSPPLWLTLSGLFQQAEDDEKASDYAFRYARYCFQNANYEPIRNHLSQFIPLPQFQSNKEFWCMLALAYKSEDIGQALYFAKKALAIQPDIQVLALMSILEFVGFNEEKSREYIDQVFARPDDVLELDIHYASQLMPILMALGAARETSQLYKCLNQMLKGRNDLFATNTLVLARVQLQQPYPERVIRAIQNLDQELLPQTSRRLSVWASISYQELFKFDRALACLKTMAGESKADPRFYRNLLLLYLSFDLPGEVKKLISEYRAAVKEHPDLKRVGPMFQLVTEILVQDPKVYEYQHICNLLIAARTGKSPWMAMIASYLDFNQLSPQFFEQVLASLRVVAVPWARHQIPRLKILARMRAGRRTNLGVPLVKAVEQAVKYGLIMERLRLYALHQVMVARGMHVPPVDYGFPEGYLERPQVARFLKNAAQRMGSPNG